MATDSTQTRLGEFASELGPDRDRCQAIAVYTGERCQRAAVAFGYCALHLSDAGDTTADESA